MHGYAEGQRVKLHRQALCYLIMRHTYIVAVGSGRMCKLKTLSTDDVCEWLHKRGANRLDVERIRGRSVLMKFVLPEKSILIVRAEGVLIFIALAGPVQIAKWVPIAKGLEQ